MDLIFLGLISGVAGFMGTLLGAGGGAFLVPIFIIGLKYSLVEAIPIVLLCSLAIGVSSVLFTPLDDDGLRKAFYFEPAAVLGALLTAPLAFYVRGEAVLICFALLILTLAYFSIRATPLLENSGEIVAEKKLMVYGVFSSLFTGFCAGLFGVGGGVILVPLLKYFSKIPTDQAAKISLFIMISTSTAGLVVHSKLGNIAWGAGLASVCGAVPAAAVANRARKKFPLAVTNTLFTIFSFGVASTIIYRAIFLGR